MPGYVTLTNRATGQDELVDADQVGAALATGKYLDPGAVAVHRDGLSTYTASDVAVREQAFAPIVDPAVAAREHGHVLRERENTGAAATAKAVIGGGLSGASFGIIDPFKDEQEFNPIASGVGQVAGMIAPAFVGDLGGLVGLGRGAAIADDAITAERATSALSSKMLYGGEQAAKAGELERGLARGNAALAGGTDAAKTADATASAGLAGLDAKGLRAAQDAELERLAQEQATSRATARSAAVDDVLTYRQTVKESNPWLVISEGETSKRFNKANNAIRAALDDAKGLRESPGSLLKPLRIEEQALQGAIENRATIAAKLDEVNAKIADKLGEDLGKLSDEATHIELTGKAARRYAAYADVKVPRGGAVSVAREDAQGFLDALTNGKVQSESRNALNKLDGLLEQNRALQEQLKSAVAPLAPKAELTSPRLSAIADAKDLLSAGAAPKSMAEQMLGGTIFSGVAGLASAIPGVGHMLAPLAGAKASKLVTDLVFGKLGKATAEIAGKTADVASRFTEIGSKVIKSPAPLLASKVLADAVFAPQPQRRGPPPAQPAGAPAKKAAAAPQPAADDLVTHYQRVTDEIRSQTRYDPTRGIVMRPEARAAMAKQLDAIRAVSPALADRMETVSARKIEYLASIIPKLPDYATMRVGPERRRTSDLQMRSFARSVAAVEDPHAAMARILSGRFVIEDAQALRAVFPEMVADLTQQILPQLPTLRVTLPYQRRLSLSMLTGQPVDVAMTPGVLRELQSMYAAEPGTMGGTQAPVPQPQFGSIKRSDPGTPAQRRQGAGLT